MTEHLQQRQKSLPLSKGKYGLTGAHALMRRAEAVETAMSAIISHCYFYLALCEVSSSWFLHH